MKADIHPKYEACEIKCACGNTIETRSTRGSYAVEICSNCHPHYLGGTGNRVLDSAGRIEKFRRRYQKSQKS